MSTKKPETTNKEAETVKTTAKAPESKYSIADFVENSAKFNADKIIVKTALELAKKKEYTEKEANDIIEKFKNKKI